MKSITKRQNVTPIPSEIIIIPLIIITLLSSALLSSAPVSADNDSVVDEINITVPVSCTLSGTGMNTHNATINNGQYNSAVGETNMKAFCNDNNGFSIYAIGYTDDTDGKNVLTNTTLGDTYDIETGTLTTGADSQWAMKLSTITSPVPTYPTIIAGSTADTDKAQGDPDYTSFQEVPDDYTKVAYRKAGTDIGTGAEGATLKSTYQAYISPTQPAGTYTGQVKYVMVNPHNAAAPEKPEAPSSACAAPFPGYTYMQDINLTNITTILSNLEEDEPYYLRDARDNQPYCVAKLKDGRLWMIDNLNIAGGTALSSTDTDFDANYTLPTTDGWTAMNGKLILPASATKNANDNNLTDSTQFSTDNYAYVFNSGNKTNCGGSDQNVPCYSYYSWDAATLGSGRNISTINTDADYSICPKNWELPTSRSGYTPAIAAASDYYRLATRYGMNTGTFNQSTDRFYNQAGPGTTLNFLLAGSYYSGSFYNGGSNGRCWSSTSSSNSTNVITLSFNSNEVYSGLIARRSSGLLVRCLVRNN